MSYTRRVKKVSHDGVLNMFDLDDDVDELTLAIDNEKQEKDAANKKTNQRNKNAYVDPLSNKNYVDPLSNRLASMKILPPSQRVPEISKKPEVIKNDAEETREARSNYSSRSTNKTESTPKEPKSTQSVLVSGTQLNQRNPNFTSNYGNRNRVTPRVNKNLKGFAHEEHDMVLDDMEDF